MMTVSCKLIIIFASHLSYFDSAIIIGFTNTSYTVDEIIGTFQVEVQIFSPPNDQPLQAAIELVIQSVSGSASKCTELMYLKY